MTFKDMREALSKNELYEIPLCLIDSYKPIRLYVNILFKENKKHKVNDKFK